MYYIIYQVVIRVGQVLREVFSEEVPSDPEGRGEVPR